MGRWEDFKTRHREKTWYKFCSATIKLGIHFGLVCLFLAAGTIGFVYLEDPVPTEEEWQKATTPMNATEFELLMQRKYNLDLSTESFAMMRDDFASEAQLVASKLKESEKIRKRKDRRFVYDKWFYFTNIVSTTIGYGDVFPVTDEGKILCISFCLTSIPLMLTLLKRIGNIMTVINTLIFKACIQRACKLGTNKYVSNELLSALTITLLLVGYISAGVMMNIILDGWYYVDSIYFWIVTFTTVGFGDMTLPIGPMQVYLMVYRLFGLALLAGVIDSLSAWVSVRQAELREKLQKKLLEHKKKLAATGGNNGLKLKKTGPRFKDTIVRLDRSVIAPRWFTDPDEKPPYIPRAQTMRIRASDARMRPRYNMPEAAVNMRSPNGTFPTTQGRRNPSYQSY